MPILQQAIQRRLVRIVYQNNKQWDILYNKANLRDLIAATSLVI